MAGTTGLSEQLLRELITAMGASVVATNNSVQVLSQTVHNLAATRTNAGGDGGTGHGYRNLKPKKDITKITADSARSLMVELAQFEIDLGERGVPPLSEAGYRQLRAVSVGRAREVIDLFTVTGRPQQVLEYLNQQSYLGGTRADCDRAGAELFVTCKEALCR